MSINLRVSSVTASHSWHIMLNICCSIHFCHTNGVKSLDYSLDLFYWYEPIRMKKEHHSYNYFRQEFANGFQLISFIIRNIGSFRCVTSLGTVNEFNIFKMEPENFFRIEIVDDYLLIWTNPCIDACLAGKLEHGTEDLSSNPFRLNLPSNKVYRTIRSQSIRLNIMG